MATPSTNNRFRWNGYSKVLGPRIAGVVRPNSDRYTRILLVSHSLEPNMDNVLEQHKKFRGKRLRRCNVRRKLLRTI
jgi:hypothetical protein